jgi:hypothetical protein
MQYLKTKHIDADQIFDFKLKKIFDFCYKVKISCLQKQCNYLALIAIFRKSEIRNIIYYITKIVIPLIIYFR